MVSSKTTTHQALLTASFWSYQICKETFAVKDENKLQNALNVLLCGGIAGVVTWTSIYPLDVIKTRLQTQAALLRKAQSSEGQHLIGATAAVPTLKNSFAITREIYQTEGLMAFFRGLGVCNARAFFVNAIQVGVNSLSMSNFAVDGVRANHGRTIA
jgi:solute carrier family 25 carnitine/acylcarnitine transporter 20/29